jgi:hypothetical protein
MDDEDPRRTNVAVLDEDPGRTSVLEGIDYNRIEAIRSPHVYKSVRFDLEVGVGILTTTG